MLVVPGSEGIRLIGIPGQEHAAYGPDIRQMAWYRKLYPLDEFVSDCSALEQARAVVEESMQLDCVKVVLVPWSTHDYEVA